MKAERVDIKRTTAEREQEQEQAEDSLNHMLKQVAFPELDGKRPRIALRPMSPYDQIDDLREDAHPPERPWAWQYDKRAMGFMEELFVRAAKKLNSGSPDALVNDILSAEDNKYILPKVTLVELENNFNRIHDSTIGGGITVSDLKDYESRNDIGPLQRFAVRNAIKNFDHISGIGESSITRESLLNSLANLKVLEQQSNARQRDRYSAIMHKEALEYISANFDKINQAGKSSGITHHDLESFAGHFIEAKDREQADRVIQRSYGLDDYDKHDGPEKFWGLFGRENAIGITRSDINIGLAIANAGQKDYLKVFESETKKWK